MHRYHFLNWTWATVANRSQMLWGLLLTFARQEEALRENITVLKCSQKTKERLSC